MDSKASSKHSIVRFAGVAFAILMIARVSAFSGANDVHAVSSLSLSQQTTTDQTTPDLILVALQAGKIDADTANLYLAYALSTYDKLPKEYQSNTPWEGTLILQQLTSALRTESAGRYQTEIAEIVEGNIGISCSSSNAVLANNISTAQFYVEYGTIGGGLSISDYMTSLETAWTIEVTNFGWAAPPLLYPANPGPLYHVRIDDLGGGLYGYVSSYGTYAGLVGDNPNTSWNDFDAYASCMVLNRDYTGFRGTPQMALDSTTGHEFNHAIQFGYGDLTGANAVSPVFYEGSATWMEDEVFDSANDNYHYLWPDFTLSMGAYFAYPYGYWITFRGLTEPYGTAIAGGGEQVMQDFWEIISQNEGAGANELTALNMALINNGTNLADAYHTYAIAVKLNKTCGGGYVYPYCFEEAGGYLATAGPTNVHVSIDSIGGSYTGNIAEGYALNWVSLPLKGTYHVKFENTSSGGSLRGSIVCDTGSSLRISPFPNMVGAGASTTLSGYDSSGCNSIVAVLTNQSTEMPGNARSYTLSLTVPAATTLISPAGSITT